MHPPHHIYRHHLWQGHRLVGFISWRNQHERLIIARHIILSWLKQFPSILGITTPTSLINAVVLAVSQLNQTPIQSRRAAIQFSIGLFNQHGPQAHFDCMESKNPILNYDSMNLALTRYTRLLHCTAAPIYHYDHISLWIIGISGNSSTTLPWQDRFKTLLVLAVEQLELEQYRFVQYKPSF